MRSAFSRFGSACFVLCSLIGTEPAWSETYTYFSTPILGEDFAAIPGDYVWRVLYCVDVGTLQNGDILTVAAESEIERPSSDTEAYVELDSMLARSSTSCDDYASSGYVYVPGHYFLGPDGFDIGADEYSAVSPKAATIQITANTDEHYIVYNVRGQSDPLTVEQGYGRLQVLKIHPDSAPSLPKK